MTLAATVLFAVFLGGMWIFFESLKKRLLYHDDSEIVHLTAAISDYELQKNELEQHLEAINAETDQQYILYQMTSGISQSLTEAQAFDVFRKYLRDHADVQNCRLVAAQTGEEPPVSVEGRTQVFYIRGDDEHQNNFLIVEGINPADAENVAVLGHQFALVYRRLQLYSQLEETAINDDLTGLQTRRALLENFYQEIKRATTHQTKTGFVMIDVDHFKKFNDNHGHLVGDQILRHVGELIRSSIREVDIPGRFGGEEFCVILPNTGLDGAQLTAERIRKAVDEHLAKAFDAEYHVTISLGVSIFPDHGTRIEDIIERADQALYQAKHQGRNQVCVYQA